MTNTLPYIKGRGAQIQMKNSFEKYHSAPLLEYFDDETTSVKSQYIQVYPKTIVNKVISPDLERMPFSLNPYQGCEHGCVYCYARNTHEFWGYNAGIDFESVILFKENAPELLEAKLKHKNWTAQPIVLSGNTDCYQPLEHRLQITRKLLQVFLKYKHPVSIITKNALIHRDVDILTELAKENLVHVSISLTGLDENLRQRLEPRTSTYIKRLKVIEALSQKGIPVNVMMAPIIPALNSHQIMEVAKTTSNAGALALNYTMVRLNGQIGVVFKDWLHKNFPDRADKVIHQIEDTHGGKLNDSRWNTRMRGEGKWANIIHQQFKVAKQLYFLNRKMPEFNLEAYQKPQLTLF
jgi:DNA repair photolyase